MIREVFKKVAQDSVIYGVGNAITRMVSLILLPIITKQLTQQEFGNWNLLTLTANVLSTFMILGLDSAVIRFFFDNDSPKYKKKLFSTGFYFMLFLCVCLFIVYFNISEKVLSLINLSNREYKYSYLVTVFWMPGMALQLYLLNWFKWTFQKYKFIFCTFGFVILNISLLLTAKYSIGLTIQNILLSSTISQWVIVLLSIILCKNDFTVNFDFKLLKKIIPYAFPFMVVMLIGSLRNSLDRFFLADFVLKDKNIVGFYSMAQRLGMFMQFFVASFDIAFNPLIFSIWNKPQAKETISKIQTSYLIIANFFSIFICAFSPLLVKVFSTEEYLNVTKILPMFLVGNLLLGLYSFACIGINFSKKSYLSMTCLIISLAVLYFVDFALTEKYQIWGVATGYCLSIITMLVTAYFFSARYFNIKFSWKRDLSVLLSGVLIAFVNVNIIIFHNFIVNAILLFIISSCIYLSFVYFCILQMGEKLMILSLLKKVKIIVLAILERKNV